MTFTARDWIIIGLSIVGPILFSFLIEIFGFVSIKDPLTLVGLIIVIIIAVYFIVSKRMNEINNDLEKQKEKFRRFKEKTEERFKIYKRLAKIEERLNIDG